MEQQKKEQGIELDAMQDFIGILANIQNGKAVIAISEELTELTKACVATQQKGSLTLTITLKPVVDTRRGEVFEMGVSLDVSAKVPRHQPGAGIFFLDKHGRMTRNSPEQEALFGEG